MMILKMTKNIMELLKFLVTPHGLLLLSASFLLIGRVVWKKRYLDCFGIIKKHLECFKKNGKYSVSSIFLYFGVPLLLAVSLTQIKKLDSDVVNVLTLIISILTSMLFALLTMILDMRKRVIGDSTYNANSASISAKVLKETYYTIMFEILVSISILILCFVELFSNSAMDESLNKMLSDTSNILDSCTSCVIYYLTFVLLANLFMVLKRIFNVINYDLENQERYR